MASNGTALKWRPAAAEGIATFLFVFLGAGTVVVTGGALVPVAFAHGLAIAMLVFATAHLSGGHINPAVTFGAIITGKIDLPQGVLYIAAQLGGAILGALLLVAVLAGVDMGDGMGSLGDHRLATGVPALGGADVAQWQGLIVEIVLTFVLVFVVFSAAMDPRGAGNIAPLAIGLAVLVDYFIGAPLTGASMNPARTLGPALIANSWGSEFWIYWVGPLVGGGLAALVYTYIFAEDKGG